MFAQCFSLAHGRCIRTRCLSGANEPTALNKNALGRSAGQLVAWLQHAYDPRAIDTYTHMEVAKHLFNLVRQRARAYVGGDARLCSVVADGEAQTPIRIGV